MTSTQTLGTARQSSTTPTSGTVRRRVGGTTLWLTGLPSAGKTTLALALAEELRSRGTDVEILDGDEVRTYLSAGLGFSRADRDTQVTRIGFVAELLARHGVIVLVPVIAPYADTRDKVRALHGERGTGYLEVHLSTPVERLRRPRRQGPVRQGVPGRAAAHDRGRRPLRGPGRSRSADRHLDGGPARRCRRPAGPARREITVTSVLPQLRSALDSELDALESEAIHILREVAGEFDRPVILFSAGKDSVLVLHLARKAFYPAPLPFSLLHVDTGHNFAEVLEYRDRVVAAGSLRLQVAHVQDWIDDGRLTERPDGTRNPLQTVPLVDTIDEPGSTR